MNCMLCENKTFDLCGEYPDESKEQKLQEKIWECLEDVLPLTTGDVEHELVCLNCKITYLRCFSCQNICKFLGHGGFDINKTTQYIKSNKPCPIKTEDTNVIILSEGKNIDDPDYIPYYVGDSEQMYAKHSNKFALTGPDGGFPVWWSCIEPTCDVSVFTTTDK